MAFLAIGMATWDRSLRDGLDDKEDLEESEGKGLDKKAQGSPSASSLACDRGRLKPGGESASNWS